MTHDFWLNLMSVFFPVICLVLAFFPGDFNNMTHVIQQWFYRRFNTPIQRRTELNMNEKALRFFGIFGLVFSLTILGLILMKSPS